MSWMQTFTGRRPFIEEPSPSDIDLVDIAHSLSRICRFGGHIAEHHSVAHHSILVSELCPPELAFIGLLHDAAEAYIGDVITPLKDKIPSLRKIEARWNIAIGIRFGIGDALVDQPDAVKSADRRILATEVRDLVPRDRAWIVGCRPDPRTIRPMKAADARAAFISRFQELAAPGIAFHRIAAMAGGS